MVGDKRLDVDSEAVQDKTTVTWFVNTKYPYVLVQCQYLFCLKSNRFTETET